MKTNREKALEWWQYNLSSNQNQELTDKYFPGEHYSYLSKREIEEIWKQETQQNLDGTTKKQVDFDRVKVTLDFFVTDHNLLERYTKEELENVQLFVELLAKSSTFAHKAHKELNKLIQ